MAGVVRLSALSGRGGGRGGAEVERAGARAGGGRAGAGDGQGRAETSAWRAGILRFPAVVAARRPAGPAPAGPVREGTAGTGRNPHLLFPEAAAPPVGTACPHRGRRRSVKIGEAAERSEGNLDRPSAVPRYAVGATGGEREEGSPGHSPFPAGIFVPGARMAAEAGGGCAPGSPSGACRQHGSHLRRTRCGPPHGAPVA